MSSMNTDFSSEVLQCQFLSRKLCEVGRREGFLKIFTRDEARFHHYHAPGRRVAHKDKQLNILLLKYLGMQVQYLTNVTCKNIYRQPLDNY
jgi:hypothetical protein